MNPRTFNMTKLINRITLFKISKEEDQRKLLDIYKGMQQKALKVRLQAHLDHKSSVRLLTQ
jgi:hypothetical protein